MSPVGTNIATPAEDPAYVFIRRICCLAFQIRRRGRLIRGDTVATSQPSGQRLSRDRGPPNLFPQSNILI